MKIKQDPITKLWCREDGAVLMPPCPNIHRFKHTWTFGYKQPSGYRTIKFHGKHYFVHQIICRAFNGLAPEGKPFVDHINRIKDDNRPENLRWVDCKENCNNKDCVDQSVEKYSVRACENRQAYDRSYQRAYYAKMKAQGLIWKRLDGKWGWYPRVRTTKTIGIECRL